jgi:transposase
MGAFIKQYLTQKGNATVVQVVIKKGREVVQTIHIGTGHTPEEIALLRSAAQDRIYEDQLRLFEPDRKTASDIFMIGAYSELLYDTLADLYAHLGFEILDDPVFRDLVVARIIEPSSKLDTIRILEDLGLDPPSNTSIHRCLKRVAYGDYRAKLATACFAAVAPKMLTLVLYDVTTLYFEVQKEDEYRIPGFSKERRLEPQITVGLLTDTSGFPLEISSFEGNRAEVDTMVPILEDFRHRHGLEDICVVADAAMLSGKNLEALEELGYHYVVGNRLAKCPYEIEEYQNKEDKELEDGQIFESTKGFTINHRHVKRRVIYQYRAKRARLDLSNIDKAVEKAKRMVAGKIGYKRNRFIKTTKTVKEVNWDLIASARKRVGIKGYVTNLDIDAQTVIDAYHRLFQIERSFRMSKSDLKARPIFHRTRDSIEAHLTIVFAALAISRIIQDRTGLSIKKFIQKLEVVRTGKLSINGVVKRVPSAISNDVEDILVSLSDEGGS